MDELYFFYYGSGEFEIQRVRPVRQRPVGAGVHFGEEHVDADRGGGAGERTDEFALAARGVAETAPEECMYMGDDVIDMPPMRRAGVAVAVADAVPELDEVADWRTRLGGGHGAVCEAIRELLIAQDKLDRLLERYRR